MDSIRRTFRAFAVANQKGGVGKTTTVINLGAALATMSKGVLVVDLDPQGNASTGLGVPEEARHVSTYDVLAGSARLEEAMTQTGVPGLLVAPATRDLAGLEPEIAAAPNRCYLFRDAINSLRASEADRVEQERLDYVLIDCPPMVSILTLNALSAADAALLPVQCEFFALESITQLKETVDFVQSSLNPALEIGGVTLTMHDGRTRLCDEVATEVRSFFGHKEFNTIIPRDFRVSEAPSYGKPLILYARESAGNRAYMDMAVETLNRELGNQTPEYPLPNYVVRERTALFESRCSVASREIEEGEVVSVIKFEDGSAQIAQRGRWLGYIDRTKLIKLRV
jgi:chromosome partitioning protein